LSRSYQKILSCVTILDLRDSFKLVRPLENVQTVQERF